METENKIFPFGKQLLLSLGILREISELPLGNLKMGVKRRFSIWRKRHAVWGGRVPHGERMHRAASPVDPRQVCKHLL